MHFLNGLIEYYIFLRENSIIFVENYLVIRMEKTITGFSKFSKEEKIDWVVSTFFDDADSARKTLGQYLNSNQIIQDVHDDFIENTISNFYLPYGVAPNFVINGKFYDARCRCLEYLEIPNIF